MQEFVRDVAAPILRGLGYQGRGGTFRYQHPDGHLAVVELRAWRIMQHDLEFHVDQALVVQAHREYIAETLDLFGDPVRVPGPLSKATGTDGVLQHRLTGAAPPIVSYWQLDRDDHAMIDRFKARLVEDATWFRSLTDPAALEARLRDDDGSLGRGSSFRAPVLLTVLLVAQGRFDELPGVLEQTERWFQHDRLLTWIERRRAAVSAGS